ncbi:MAG: hydrogenase maturation protease [Candidatus Thermoplasmatota archaeon]|nr:hydrogenase maturation protease [Candidatus Thermoplasmatota archaeon]
MARIGVIGLGNILRRDDGIGVVLLNLLKTQKDPRFKDIEFIDGGTGGMNLLHLLPRFDVLLLIDAINFQGFPGESRLFRFKELQQQHVSEPLSTHITNILRVLSLSEQLHELPTEVLLFGIQPKDISPGTSLSDDVAHRVNDTLNALIDELQRLVSVHHKK